MKAKLFIYSVLFLTAGNVFASDSDISAYEKSLLCRAVASRYSNYMRGNSDSEKLVYCRDHAFFSKDENSYLISSPTETGFITCAGEIGPGENNSHTNKVRIHDCKKVDRKPRVGVSN